MKKRNWFLFHWFLIITGFGSWFLAIWLTEYRGQLFFTGLLILLIKFLFELADKEKEKKKIKCT